MLVRFFIFYLFFARFSLWKGALFLSPTHSPFLLLSDGRIPPQFLARFFAIPRSTPCCERMLVSFLTFYLFSLSFFPWKRALFLSPTHSLLRLLSDGRIPSWVWEWFFAIPRSTLSCEAMLVRFFIFTCLLSLFCPWKHALFLSPPHSLLCLLSDGRIPAEFL